VVSAARLRLRPSSGSSPRGIVRRASVGRWGRARALGPALRGGTPAGPMPVPLEIDRASLEPDAFGLEPRLLFAGPFQTIGRAAALRVHHPMPRQVRRTRVHRPPDRLRRERGSRQRIRDLPVRHHPPPRDPLHDPIHLVERSLRHVAGLDDRSAKASSARRTWSMRRVRARERVRAHSSACSSSSSARAFERIHSARSKPRRKRPWPAPAMPAPATASSSSSRPSAKTSAPATM
jgi:hypothetical protein